jgi:hypothetical protein
LAHRPGCSAWTSAAPVTPLQYAAGPRYTRPGWCCFGCQRGGRIYDLASLLAGGAWGRDLRGEAFRSARELVAAALG